MTSKAWRTYEEAAQYLLEQFSSHFGLGRVEGKQVVQGASGTSWEIDAKGIKADGGGIVLVECRHIPRLSSPKSSLAESHFASLTLALKVESQ